MYKNNKINKNCCRSHLQKKSSVFTETLVSFYDFNFTCVLMENIILLNIKNILKKWYNWLQKKREKKIFLM
jgi:hypothetical protein